MTTLKLSDFKARLSDFARPNRFSIELNPPSFLLSDLGFTNIDLTNWLAQTATIPARNQGEITLKYHGMELKLPGDYSKENLSITFLNDYGFVGRFLFESWMEFGVQKVGDTNERINGLLSIMDSSIVVKQLGRNPEDVLASYRFFNVFPVSISSIDLDMSSSDQVEKFTVGFAYSHFENMDMY